jgi:release factor glutamine methyltransferase
MQLVVLATDVNAFACACTLRTLQANNLSTVEAINTSLFEGMRLTHKVDVLVFNPPYVPTEEEELGSHGIEASWAGGTYGTNALDKLLPHVASLLSPRGVFYLVALQHNKPLDIIQKLQTNGLNGTVGG